MSNVSVVCIAETDEELSSVKRDVNKQTIGCEFVGVTGGTIPEAWNRGLEQADGDIVLFTESDVELPRDWAEELAEQVRRHEQCVVLGHEVRVPDPVHCMSSVGIHKTDAVPFNEDMRLTEDTDWFARLQERGVELVKTRDIPVVWHRKTRPHPVRSFWHGVHRAEIWLDHNYEGKTAAGVTSRRVNRMLCEAATLLGQAAGILRHPRKLWRKLR